MKYGFRKISISDLRKFAPNSIMKFLQLFHVSRINLLKDNNFSHNEPINIIPINIDLERKLYLYKKIRNFVEEPHKDVHFSNTDSNEMEIN